MTTSEFKEIAKKEKSLNIYSVKNISHGDDKGFLITYSVQLNPTTVSTEKTKEFWNMDLDQVAKEFLYN